MCHRFFGISGYTNTVFGLTLNPKINQGVYQTCKIDARTFDMSKVLIRRETSQKFILCVIFHSTFFNRCLSVIVLTLSNEVTDKIQLVNSY